MAASEDWNRDQNVTMNNLSLLNISEFFVSTSPSPHPWSYSYFLAIRSQAIVDNAPIVKPYSREQMISCCLQKFCFIFSVFYPSQGIRVSHWNNLIMSVLCMVDFSCEDSTYIYHFVAQATYWFAWATYQLAWATCRYIDTIPSKLFFGYS